MKAVVYHGLGVSPPGCCRGVDYLWALAQLLSQAVPSPVNSGHCIFCSLLFVILTALQPPQSNPNPSFQPVDSIVYHSDHLTLLLTTSMHPFFYRGKSTLCRVFLDPSAPHLLPRSPTASTYQRRGAERALLPSGQDKFFI